MIREIIKPDDHAHWLQMRTQDITSSEVAALFGLSPYMTLFELWHRKKDGTVVELEGNDRMKWGNRLEPAIAHGIAEDHGWQIQPMKDYYRLPELRLGSSFDFAIVEPHDNGSGLVEMVKKSLLEIKNVDGRIAKQNWQEDDDENEAEAPPHIELQVQQQMLVSGLDHGYIGALQGGNTVMLLERRRDDYVCNQILEKAAAFWKSIDDNNPPLPDWEKDAEFIKEMYSFANPGDALDARDNPLIAQLAINYKEAAQESKAAEERKQGIKAELLTLIGPVEKVFGEGFTISAGMIGPCHMNYERSGYRNFKVNFSKPKKK